VYLVNSGAFRSSSGCGCLPRSSCCCHSTSREAALGFVRTCIYVACATWGLIAHHVLLLCATFVLQRARRSHRYGFSQYADPFIGSTGPGGTSSGRPGSHTVQSSRTRTNDSSVRDYLAVVRRRSILNVSVKFRVFDREIYCDMQSQSY
jgi:hypothetical protein